jgi:hypothetical protein
MPRPERPLDPLAGPVQAFAAELRKLRDQAGNPKYLQMARLTGKSRTALAEAAGGDHLPTWETVEAYVVACGGDAVAWRFRWEEVEEQVRVRRGLEPRQPAPPPVERPVTWVDPSRHAAIADRRLVALVGVLVVLVVLSASTAGVALLARGDGGSGGRTDQAAGPPGGLVYHSSPRPVEIHSADSAPVRLATRPAGGCVDRGCALPERAWPGEYWVASCYVVGEMMTDANPDRVDGSREQNRKDYRSDGWYGLPLYDGRLGYLAEVNVTPEYRGGLNLPACPEMQPLQPR